MQREKNFRPQNGRWLPPSVRWHAFARPLKLLPIALTLTAVLCLPGCASAKKMASEQTETTESYDRMDTTLATMRLRTTEPIPPSKAELVISLDSLVKLPDGAMFTRHEGNVRADVSRDGPNIRVTATSDSLQREIEFYEALYHTARDELERRNRTDTRNEQKSNTYPAWLPIIVIAHGIVLVLGVIILIIISTRKKQ